MLQWWPWSYLDPFRQDLYKEWQQSEIACGQVGTGLSHNSGLVLRGVWIVLVRKVLSLARVSSPLCFCLLLSGWRDVWDAASCNLLGLILTTNMLICRHAGRLTFWKMPNFWHASKRPSPSLLHCELTYSWGTLLVPPFAENFDHILQHFTKNSHVQFWMSRKVAVRSWVSALLHIWRSALQRSRKVTWSPIICFTYKYELWSSVNLNPMSPLVLCPPLHLSLAGGLRSLNESPRQLAHLFPFSFFCVMWMSSCLTKAPKRALSEVLKGTSFGTSIFVLAQRAYSSSGCLIITMCYTFVGGLS